MKKILFLLFLLPSLIFGQYVTVPTHYDSEHTAEHIMKGHIKMYLKDTIKFTTEKKNERYVTDCGVDPNRVKSKLDKVFKKGKLEYSEDLRKYLEDEKKNKIEIIKKLNEQ